MLSKLSVKNYALIDTLEIDFSEGFSTITGETGAGKSILLGALGLVLGQRADLNSIRDKEVKCVIEAIFDITKYQLEGFFEEEDLDYEKRTIIRREITPSGKSRAFINDTPVNLEVLNKIAAFLIDIHSQHQTLTLNRASFQLNVLDAVAGNHKNVQEFQNGYDDLSVLKQKLTEIEGEQEQLQNEFDYNSFLHQELAEANLKDSEQQSMEEELSTLSNAEEIKQLLVNSFGLLDAEEMGVISNLREVKSSLEKAADYNTALRNIAERIESALLELRDISSEIEVLEQNTEYQPDRINQLNEKLDLIYRLQQKHQVDSIEELLEIQEALSDKLQQVIGSEERIKALNSEINTLESDLLEKAKTLSENRKKAIPQLQSQVQDSLVKLGMPKAQFKVEQIISNELSSTGIDKINFLFTANSGSALQPIAKVASGGELSRLMLSIKAILAKHSNLPSIIFDEIDTGISGEIAGKMGLIMQEMGKTMQVIAITHLPQIAGKGNRHYQVFKAEENGVTTTAMSEVVGDERIDAIAKMLSGEELTDAALANAKELLKA